MGPNATDFADAMAVPQLAQACISILNTSDQPGSGLKLLRLLSRSMRQMLTSVVRAYSLQLRGDGFNNGIGITEAVRFLKQTRLVCLRLTSPPVVPESAGHRRSPTSASQFTSDDAALQLIRFLEEVGPFLSGVTRLEVTLRNPLAGHAAEYASANMCWDPLAHALPKLQQLYVRGSLAMEGLHDFGSSCHHLSTVELKLTDIPYSSIFRLQTLLPHLTSLSLLPHTRLATGSNWEVMKHHSNARSVLHTCPKLVSYHHCPHPINEVWGSLPRGLLELHSYYDCRVPDPFASNQLLAHEVEDLNAAPLLGLHSSLRRLHINVGSAFWLHDLADILRAAPRLTELNVVFNTEWMNLGFSPLGVADLSLLAARLNTGLVMTIRKGRKIAGNNHLLVLEAGALAVDSVQVGDGSCGVSRVTMSQFLATLPPIPSIAHVELEIEECHNGGSFLTNMARIFPSLETVVVNNISGANLHTLAPCKVLRVLRLCHVSDTTVEGLASVCEQIPALEMLGLDTCEGWQGREAEKLVGILEERKIAVRIETGNAYHGTQPGESQESNDESDEQEDGEGQEEWESQSESEEEEAGEDEIDSDHEQHIGLGMGRLHNNW